MRKFYIEKQQLIIEGGFIYAPPFSGKTFMCNMLIEAGIDAFDTDYLQYYHRDLPDEFKLDYGKFYTFAFTNRHNLPNLDLCVLPTHSLLVEMIRNTKRTGYDLTARDRAIETCHRLSIPYYHYTSVNCDMEKGLVLTLEPLSLEVKDE